MAKFPISKIKVRNRYRKSLGDVQSLATSIEEVGLLHPVVVRPDGRLVAGERRLRACRLLGWKTIPATVIDIDEVVRGEWAENAHRADFTPTEVYAIKKALEPIERAAAKKRMSEGGKGVKVSQPSRVTDRIGAVAGLSGRTVEKISAIMEAAERQPRRYRALVEELDRTRRVDAIYRTLRQKQDEERQLSVKPLKGKFRTIVIDCPWQYQSVAIPRSNPDYATMSQKELLALPVTKWAEDDAHLYVWAPNSMIPEALELMKGWGFRYVSILTWVKPGLGLGTHFRNTTEQVLFGIKGRLTTRPPNNLPTHFEARKTRHSAKPDEFYRFVERASYPPFVDVFARKRRTGWTSWGGGLGEAA